MRLFVALELPAELRARLSSLLRSLRSDLPDARWVRAEALHLTLAFLGERSQGDVDALQSSLLPVFARYHPFAVRVGGAGVFPHRRAARVLWLGLDGGDALGELQGEVSQAVTDLLDVSLDRRPFRPHLTLARCRRPWSEKAVRRFEEAASLRAEFEVDHGTLFESTLAPGGAVHDELARFPLRPAQRADHGPSSQSTEERRLSEGANERPLSEGANERPSGEA